MSIDKRDTKRVTADVSIFGENLIISGQSSVDYIEAVSDYVNEKLGDIQSNYPRMSKFKIMALGAMNLADELNKANQLNERLEAEIIQLRKEKDELRKENEKVQNALVESESKAQHYQKEYEELELLLEDEG